MIRFFFLFVISLLSACSNKRETLRFNLSGDTIQLDWNRANDTNSVIVLDNIMEGLTTYADSLKTGTTDFLRPLPALASSWALSEQGTVYRFNLRKHVFWTDGVELRAQQFVDSWQRLLDPDTKSENSYHLFDVMGAREFAEGKNRDFSKVGIRALDDYTLEVRLRRAAPYFLHLVTHVSTFPIRKDLLSTNLSFANSPERLVTLGPYRLSSWEHGRQLILEANKTYWGAAPAIRTVICKAVPEPLTAEALYENDELDILPRDLPSSMIDRLAKRADFQTGPRLSVSYLVFNTRKAPFDRAENRRAFIRAIDRNALVAAFHGSQKATSSWIPPGLLGYQSEDELKPILGKAADFSAPVTMRYSGNDTWNLTFQILQKSLKEKANFSLRLEQVDWKEFHNFLSALAEHSLPKGERIPDILHMSWVADYPDAHSFMNVFTSSSESNYSGWKNREYDSLVDKAVSTQESVDRERFYAQAQKILLVDEAVIMPLFVTSHQALVRADFHGVVLNPLDKWYFRSIHLEK